jgi:hypothetical protein
MVVILAFTFSVIPCYITRIFDLLEWCNPRENESYKGTPPSAPAEEDTEWGWQHQSQVQGWRALGCAHRPGVIRAAFLWLPKLSLHLFSNLPRLTGDCPLVLTYRTRAEEEVGVRTTTTKMDKDGNSWSLPTVLSCI